jgi:hypothetical protein
MNNLILFNEINRVARQYDNQALQLMSGKRSKSGNIQAQLCKQFSSTLYEISANLYALNFEQPQPQPEAEESDDV